jgi:uncharacterized protein
METIHDRLAAELNVTPARVSAAVKLFDDGATVPFVARYRKEATGAMDDAQLRLLQQRLVYLRELDERRKTVLKSIDEQGKLTDALKKSILSADTKARLEDLYLPYKPKRRTKAQIAIEAGLEPLADALFNDSTLSPEETARAFVHPDNGVADAKAALEGALYILMERIAEDADLLGRLRHYLARNGRLAVRAVPGKEEDGAKYRDYFDYQEAVNRLPSHRLLAVLRGRNEGFLRVTVEVGDREERLHPCERIVADHIGFRHQNRLADNWLQKVVRSTWSAKLAGSLEAELITDLRGRAEAEAIDVFAKNLKDLLLAAPAGPRTTMGLDPGYRAGVKVAVVDATGKVLEYATIYPHAPENQWARSIELLAALCVKHKVELISIGNGTASRETDKMAGELTRRHIALRLTKIVVSEAGASVYSASELGTKEFPELDVSIRGAISIARRLQDPLAELVKIEPKSIGVGQYQHDVNQAKLARSLEAIVEDCVNAVGVDLNTASVSLLSRISGLTATIAANIVAHREQYGRFRNRRQLLKVPRLGQKSVRTGGGIPARDERR